MLVKLPFIQYNSVGKEKLVTQRQKKSSSVEMLVKLPFIQYNSVGKEKIVTQQQKKVSQNLGTYIAL